MIKNTGDALFLSTITICMGIVVWAFVAILGDETNHQELAQISTSQEDSPPKVVSNEATEAQTEDTGTSQDDMEQAKEAIRKAEVISQARGILPSVRYSTAERLLEFCEEAPSLVNTDFEYSSWPDIIWNILNTADYCKAHSPREAENVWLISTLFFHDTQNEKVENIYAEITTDKEPIEVEAFR